MKYLKLYKENIENEPKIGDYVICEDSSLSLDNITIDFISNNIGKIIGIDEFGQYYIVKYDYNTIPNLSKNWFGSISKTGYPPTYSKEEDSRVMYLSEIIKFSKDRTELEEYLMAIKYGL